MKSMRKILIVVFVCLPGLAWSETEIDWHMEAFDGDLTNKPSLQNGMRLYVNYCLGCHSLKYQRYERTVDFLGIPHDMALENLVFSDQKIGDLMTSAMEPQAAKAWFGAPPPDLTQVTKTRGDEWLYNYLLTFYDDPSRPFGVNNKVFPNVGMPNVLADLQGVQREVCVQEDCSDLQVDEGSGAYTAEEFDAAVYDLTNFLYYVGEPTRLERHRLGIYVMLFLVILGCFTYLLNREYWKDVH
jgi:ubiquinol-cytochrome c reductase cytochrome c1 subunit